MTAIVPTLRAGLLLAASAPVALLIAAIAPAAWIVAPALGGALLVLVVIDALMAGSAADLSVRAPRDIEIGAAGELVVRASFARGQRSAVEAALRLDPRLASGGGLNLALRPT